MRRPALGRGELGLIGARGAALLRRGRAGLLGQREVGLSGDVAVALPGAPLHRVVGAGRQQQHRQSRQQPGFTGGELSQSAAKGSLPGRRGAFQLGGRSH